MVNVVKGNGRGLRLVTIPVFAGQDLWKSRNAHQDNRTPGKASPSQTKRKINTIQQTGYECLFLADPIVLVIQCSDSP